MVFSFIQSECISDLVELTEGRISEISLNYSITLALQHGIQQLQLEELQASHRNLASLPLGYRCSSKSSGIGSYQNTMPIIYHTRFFRCKFVFHLVTNNSIGF